MNFRRSTLDCVGLPTKYAGKLTRVSSAMCTARGGADGFAGCADLPGAGAFLGDRGREDVGRGGEADDAFAPPARRGDLTRGVAFGIRPKASSSGGTSGDSMVL